MMNNWLLLSIFLLIKEYYIFIYVHDIHTLLIHILKWYLATKMNNERIINLKMIKKIIIAIQISKEYNISKRNNILHYAFQFQNYLH